MQRQSAESQESKCGGFHTRWVLRLHSEVPDLGGPNGLFHFLGSIIRPGS